MKSRKKQRLSWTEADRTFALVSGGQGGARPKPTFKWPNAELGALRPGSHRPRTKRGTTWNGAFGLPADRRALRSQRKPVVPSQAAAVGRLNDPDRPSGPMGFAERLVPTSDGTISTDSVRRVP